MYYHYLCFTSSGIAWLLIRACPPPTVTAGRTVRPPGAQEVRVRTFTHTGGHRHFL